MRIICDSCGAKYSIADEKVKGKVFKIRCKKCQHIIVVRGGSDDEGATAQTAQPESSEGPAGGEAPVWHVVIDREQVGPMTDADVRGRFASGEINAETYIWREGFADWVRLNTVDEFADIARATPMADVGAASAAPASQWEAPAAQAPAESRWPEPAAAEAQGWSADQGMGAEAAGLSGPADQGAGDLFGSSAAAPAAEGGGLFKAPAAEAEEPPGGGMFQSAAVGGTEPPAASEGGGGSDLFGGGGGGQQLFPDDESADSAPQSMTGQRGENSVLFSLSNLQQLAMGGGGGKAPSSGNGASLGAPAPAAGGGSADAGSGLIDIRSMAAETASTAAPAKASDEPEIPGYGGFAAPVVAAPVLIPAAEERPKWLLPTIIGMGGLVLVLVVVLLVVLLTREEKQPVQVAANVPSSTAGVQPAQAGAAAQTGTAAVEKTATAEEKSAEASETDKPAEKAEEGDKGDKSTARASRRSRRGRARRGRSSRRESRPAAAAALPDPSPRSSKPKSRRKRDSLDDLIDGALGGGAKPQRRKARQQESSADSNLPETLSRSEIQGGMRRIKGRVQSCYDKFKVPGLANVQVKIGRNGRVSSAQVKGIFSGTPTGACVAAAVRAASFPRFKGAPITIAYPFVLR